VLRRTRADWRVLSAAWVLLASAIALLAAGTLYTDAVTLAGLHRELREASPADRAVVVRTQILPERLEQADKAIVPELSRVIAASGGDIARDLRSSPFAAAGEDPSKVARLMVFAALDGIREHGTLTGGRWPEPGHDPVEVVVSDAAMQALGLTAGVPFDLVGRLDGRHVQAVVTGTWAPDPADPYWLADPLVLAGSEAGGSFTIVGPLVADVADVTGPLAGGRPLDARWRAVPAIEGFRAETIDAVSAEVGDLREQINANLPETNQATVTTRLIAAASFTPRRMNRKNAHRPMLESAIASNVSPSPRAGQTAPTVDMISTQ